MEEQGRFIDGIPVPDDYKSVINVMGFSFGVPNLIEGGILGAFGALIGYCLPSVFDFELDLALFTTLIMTLGFAFGIIGIVGINDGRIYEYILDCVRYFKDKRTAYYNPRVKVEMVSVLSVMNSNNVVSKEKIEKLFEEYKKKFAKKEQEKALAQQENGEVNINQLVFEDDPEEGGVQKHETVQGTSRFSQLVAKIKAKKA